MSRIDRRDFMKLLGLGGVVFASGLGANVRGVLGANRPRSDGEDFYL
jgi:hypothetical protein